MRALTDNLKNLPGWRTNRKLVVFAVDDYGNVRVDSRQALDQMVGAGLKVASRFDRYDALETKDDLAMLFEVLTSVKDSSGSGAVFTPFALACNIDFEAMEGADYSHYCSELLPQTFQKLSARWPKAYDGAWALWQEGQREGIFVPEFHGREHFNLPVFQRKLANRDRDLMVSLENRSLACVKSGTGVKMTAAFGFDRLPETDHMLEVVSDGLDKFQKIFGRASVVFTPPAHQFPFLLEPKLKDFGLLGLDKPFLSKEQLGGGSTTRVLRTTGYNRRIGMCNVVRNVVFEPTEGTIKNWVSLTMKQIAAAFRWGKPAIISSHRVNFCGHIDSANRARGLNALGELLVGITKRWPEVEFISAQELVSLIRSPYRSTNN